MELRKIRVTPSGRDVHYYRAGKGEPLLYLHHVAGLAGFEPALARLAESFDVVAPYAPGWGPAKDDLAGVERGPLDLALHHADLLDALGLPSAHVVGISIGAWMAAELAAIFPDCVRHLVLVNPLGIWLEHAQGADPFAQHPLEPTRVLFGDPKLRESTLLAVHANPVEGLIAEMLALRASAKFLWPIPDTGVAARLPRIRATTLVVTSEKDAVVPEAHGAAWQAGIRDARRVTLAGAGHLAELEQPEAFAALVRAFALENRIASAA
jgi:pimeloyl-ACP methyl ester carboxylesterase